MSALRIGFNVRDSFRTKVVSDWKRYGDPCPSIFTIGSSNGSAVGACNSINKCKAEPVPLRLSTLHAALE
jgi:hypothetical protein